MQIDCDTQFVAKCSQLGHNFEQAIIQGERP
jgi:hypothetical protein